MSPFDIIVIFIIIITPTIPKSFILNLLVKIILVSLINNVIIATYNEYIINIETHNDIATCGILHEHFSHLLMLNSFNIIALSNFQCLCFKPNKDLTRAYAPFFSCTCRNNELLMLFHINLLIQFAIQECCFDFHLMHIKVMQCFK